MRYNERSLEEFKIEFYRRFPNSILEILRISERKNKDGFTSYVLVRDKYGVCEVIKQSLLRSGECSIVSSTDKLVYFINRLIEVFPNYTNYYNIVNQELDLSQRYILVETKYGICRIKRSHLLNKVIPTIEVSIDKTKYFINQFKEKFPISNYTFEKAQFIRSNIKIISTCKKHGDFNITPNSLLNGTGCKKCGIEKLKIINSDNPVGWSKTNWFNSANKSKYFDSFKVYLLEIYNEDEKFYKIGRTFLKIKDRFRSLPYNYKIIKVFEFKDLTQINCNFCYDLENKLKRENKLNKYVPKFKFDGMQECFNKIEK